MNVNIAEKKLELHFNLAEMEALEKYRGKPLDVQELGGELKDHNTLLDVIRILAGEEAPEKDWLKKHIRPGRLPGLTIKVYETISEGMSMDELEEPDDPNRPVDVTLEEIKKKEAVG